VARRLGVSEDDAVVSRLAWAGLFDDVPLPTLRSTPLDLLCCRLAERMRYAPGQRDLVVLENVVRYEAPRTGTREIRSLLTARGEPDGPSAMARTVSLPAAIAARLILEGRIGHTGVAVPVHAEIFGPILDELAELGVSLRETVGAVSGGSA
jgi:saccharopine dehydrogenase-like NADP-dependent oxidoreductase